MVDFDPFADERLLMALLMDERRTLDLDASLMWENLKFFVPIVTLLITADLTLTEFFLVYGRGMIILPMVTSLVGVLVIALSFFGFSDLKERFRRMLMITTHVQKLELRLGIRAKMEPGFFEPYPDDVFLFQFHGDRLGKFRTSQAFLDDALRPLSPDGKLRRNMLWRMAPAYAILVAFGLVLVILNVVLAFT